ITADGAVAWSSNVGTDWANSFLPDFQGGLVVYNQSTIYKLDGLTGQAYPAYQASPDVTDIGTPAIHTDGTIFALDHACTGADCLNSEGWLVGIDPSSGTSKFRAPTVNSTFQGTNTSNNYDRNGNPFCGSGSQTFSYYPWPKSPRILGDGYAYTTYVTYHVSSTTTEAGQPLPLAAYDYFDLLRQHTGDSQFDAALS